MSGEPFPTLKELLEKYRELERKVEDELIRLREENKRLKEELAKRRESPEYERMTEELRQELQELKALKAKADHKISELETENAILKQAISRAIESLTVTGVQAVAVAPQPNASNPPKAQETLVENLSPYEKAIYDFLASNRGTRFTAFQIAVATKRSVKSSAFRATLAKLVKLGLVKRQGSLYYAE